MVTPEQMPSLLQAETDRIEWKQSVGQREAILRAVCALANDLAASGGPGYVIVGVEKSGQTTGIGEIRTVDRQQKELADHLRSSKIQPVPSCSITMLAYGGGHLLVLEVEPYPVLPSWRWTGMRGCVSARLPVEPPRQTCSA